MANQYNFIYEKLVTAGDDVLGLIAYGIYKQHKIEFITKIKEENEREPTQDECNSFFAASTTESQLDNYRNQAEALLSETVANIANEELGRFEDELIRSYKKEIKDCIPGNWKTFFVSVGAGVVSAFLFAWHLHIGKEITPRRDRRLYQLIALPLQHTEFKIKQFRWDTEYCGGREKSGVTVECFKDILVSE